MKYGYGYGFIPLSKEQGCAWYATEFPERSSATKECRRELSYFDRQLYTQFWIQVGKLRIKVPGTWRKA